MARIPVGPRKDWGRWAESRHKKISKPKRLKTVKTRALKEKP